MKIRPLQDRIIVKRVDGEETTKGGIIIPDSAKEKPQEAKVVALGTGATDDDGKKIAFEVAVGTRVACAEHPCRFVGRASPEFFVHVVPSIGVVEEHECHQFT